MHSDTAGGLPPVSPAERRRLLGTVLRDVSRAFYLSLWVLPGGMREPVGLAYLLARAADTIADTRLLAPHDRLTYLLAFKAQVLGPASPRVLLDIQQAVAVHQEMPAERRLIASLPQACAVLEGLRPREREEVREVVSTLISGMEVDLATFPPEGSGQVVALASAAELDRYTYLVAGCVGEFWTRMSAVHERELRRWNVPDMARRGVRFGKALQLVNVLRDLPRDLRNGRCYLPEDELREQGLTPADLLSASASDRARPLLLRWVRVALEHFRHAEAYALAVPTWCPRLRLSVLWPILIGLATLAELAARRDWLDPSRPAKVTRGWIYRMMLLSLPAALFQTPMRMWLERLRKRVESQLHEPRAEVTVTGPRSR